MCWTVRPVVNHSLCPPAATSHNKGDQRTGRQTHIFGSGCVLCNTEVYVCVEGEGGRGGRLFLVCLNLNKVLLCGIKKT